MSAQVIRPSRWSAAPLANLLLIPPSHMMIGVFFVRMLRSLRRATTAFAYTVYYAYHLSTGGRCVRARLVLPAGQSLQLQVYCPYHLHVWAGADAQASCVAQCNRARRSYLLTSLSHLGRCMWCFPCSAPGSRVNRISYTDPTSLYQGRCVCAGQVRSIGQQLSPRIVLILIVYHYGYGCDG